MDLRKVKIGVLGGGVSPEREISLVSADEACKALSRHGLNVVFIDINSSQKEDIEALIRSQGIEIAFIALHGKFGEDGGIQEILQGLGLPYTGSSPRGSFLAMNKALSKQIFKTVGIRTPEFSVCCDCRRIPSGLNYPLVIKPCSSGSSLGISIVQEVGQLPAALDKAFSHQDIVLLEDYIEGRELTVGILNQQPLGVVEIIPKKGYYDFQAKYSDGLTDFIAPAKIPEDLYQRIQIQAQAAHKSLGCRHFSRVDLRLDQNGTAYVLEVNSIPGLTSHSLLPLSAKVCGIEFDELILKMTELALKPAELLV
ncbi:MAG: D-alanine--D-alanine ligase [Candidatus Omnitrophica bacterium]|nr:D-alanine--D-alanine ligase [Candidatus Omnitrophota bacterium]MBU2044843.1 D-alanine--D-alanine ligase [Candidatus Omnitrophota bacterium]MBU2473642.1 D-alanine--D-alanine ligase [Candidatus Omnitrophota bacterium]